MVDYNFYVFPVICLPGHKIRSMGNRPSVLLQSCEGVLVPDSQSCAQEVGVDSTQQLCSLAGDLGQVALYANLSFLICEMGIL